MSDVSYEDLWNRHLDTSFDELLKSLLATGLRWIPWIGREYSKCSERILVVGESHYVNELDLSKVIVKKAECHANIRHTREIMAEYPLEGYEAGWSRNNPTFDNLHRALLKNDLLQAEDIDKRGRLWKLRRDKSADKRPPSPRN
jgi:hypothetical protein